MGEKTKRCSRCKKTKPLSEFYVRRRRPGRAGGPYSACKTCLSKENREYHATRRNTWRERLYGLTSEEYDRLFAEQNGCCGICGRHYYELGRELDVDHNHRTGQVRGLLCRSCNTKLGWYAKQEQNISDYLGDKDDEY